MIYLRTVDLDALNSATKYPSIPTYHTLDPGNGGLREETVAFKGEVIGTEKVDGTNSRVICLPGGEYVIGSREELLYARGDLIGNPALGIVAALRGLADTIGAGTVEAGTVGAGDGEVTTYYLEVYGGKVTAASGEYTGNRTVGYRMFDVATVPLAVLEWPPERISRWREDGGQRFLDEPSLASCAARNRIELTPRLFTLDAADLPTGIEPAEAFLAEHVPHTRVALDEGGKGQAEGIVLRAPDRSVIAKARFQDYRRTLKRRNSTGNRRRG